MMNDERNRRRRGIATKSLRFGTGKKKEENEKETSSATDGDRCTLMSEDQENKTK
jgi:hypothetical protein